MKNSKYFMMSNSPWPLLTSSSSMVMIMEFYLMMNYLTKIPMGLMLTMISIYQWMRDTNRESLYQGNHSNNIQKMLKNSMILFILSEVFLFISLFWAFISNAICPDVTIGSMWPPKGMMSIWPLDLPALNTIILLSSGATISWAHHSMSKSSMKETMNSMMSTISLGIMFLTCMMIEYKMAFFSMNSSCFGSLFFLITGFHGSHVIMGTILLLISTLRMKKIKVSKKHMTTVEFSIWYWHFVDVVWLVVYATVYWMSAYLMK